MISIIEKVWKNWYVRKYVLSRRFQWDGDNAAKLKKLFLLIEHGNEMTGFTKKAMDWAASNGHLIVVEWLHKNRSEGCEKWTMDLAAKNGHLDVVKWLYENRSEGCTMYIHRR